MLRKSCLVLLVALTLLVSSLAFAEETEGYPVAMANRPLTLDKGIGEVGLQLGLGLDSGRAAKDMLLGVDFGYGLSDSFELGLNILALNYAGGTGYHGADFGGAAIYMTWDFLGFLGLYADVHFPGIGGYLDTFKDQLVGINVGLPAQYTIIKDMLKIHGGVFLDVGFAKEAIAGKTPQLAMEIDLGVTLSLIQRLYIDLSFAADMALRPEAVSNLAMPLALTVGYTVIDPMDIYLAFAFNDLNNNGADRRMLVLGAAFRF